MGTKISVVENFLLENIFFFVKKMYVWFVLRLKGLGETRILLHFSPTALTSRFVVCYHRVNDPSAGSPTETLLRLLLPLSDKVYLTSRSGLKAPSSPGGSPYHSKSVGATGGVYKGQGRNQYKLMTCTY